MEENTNIIRSLFKKDNEIIIKQGSIIGGIMLILLGILIILFTSLTFVGIIFLMLGAVISILPSSLFVYFNFSKYSKMEDQFPRFLRDLAEAKKSGMTFQDAFKSRMNTDYGLLNPEIAKANNELSWGIPFIKVMKNLSDRLSYSSLMRRSFTIILEAFNAGGDVTDVMDDLSTDIKTIKNIDDERKSEMSQQVIMVYFISFLFVAITLMLYHVLIPLLNSDFASIFSASGMGSASDVNYCAYASWLCSICVPFSFGEGTLCYMEAIFFLMSMVQAITSGFIAGEINEGSLVAGVKHSLFLLSMVFIIFIIFG